MIIGHPELRISFHAHDERDDRSYEVELHFTVPDSDDEIPFGPFMVVFDWDKFAGLFLPSSGADSPDSYGEALSEAFFKESKLKDAFARVRGLASKYPSGLRLRLCLSSATRQLHNVPWERIQDPETHARLATDEHILISRFLSGGEAPLAKLRERAALRALVMIANPRGLDNQRVEDLELAPVAVDEEWQRAKESLKSIDIKKLAAPEKRPSLENLMAELREGDGFDILYLVCHGALIDDEPWLWLEKESGDIHRVHGGKLVTRLKEMRDLPRLVVLASCQSGGRGEDARTGDSGAFAALAPRIAAAGVPAVIAMQSNLRMATASLFFPAFFEELLKDGQIDRAVAVARAAIRDCADWWVPVLITRLQKGRIWYEHGGGDNGFPEKEWRSIIHDVASYRCTPLIGPDLSASFLGLPTELARSLADRYEFPLAARERDNLQEVAQYLAWNPNRATLEREFSSHLWRRLVRHFPDKIPPGVVEKRNVKIDLPLVDLITHVWRARLCDNDPYKLLAAMPFPVFITATRDNLLVEALKAQGKNPRREICRWRVLRENFSEGWPDSIFTEDPKFRPSIQSPLVFYAFGHMEYPATLVLTEDDYFEYLIGVTQNVTKEHTTRVRETGTQAIPEAVKNALSRRGLLFLGFRISHWEFRTLFRRALAQEGSALTSPADPRHTSVSVQLEPLEGGEYDQPEGARQYLNHYFQPRRVQIFWGNAERFIQTLHEKWTREGSPTPDEKDLH